MQKTKYETETVSVPVTIDDLSNATSRDERIALLAKWTRWLKEQRQKDLESFPSWEQIYYQNNKERLK